MRDLTPGDKTKAMFAGWTADGQAFFVLTNERDPKKFDLYRYSARDYERSLVFRNDDALQVEAVSPDGRYVAMVKPRTSADSDLYLLDLQAADAKPRLITPHTGNVNHGTFNFTRDSRQLVYATDEHGEFTQAWTYEIADGRKAPLIAAPWTCRSSPSPRPAATASRARTTTRARSCGSSTVTPARKSPWPACRLATCRR